MVLQNFHQRSEDKLDRSSLQPIFPSNCKIGEYPRPTYFMMLQKMHETKHRPNWFVYSECVTSKLLWTDQTPNQRSASKMYTCTWAEHHLTNGTKPNQTLLISRVDIVHVCPPVLKTWTHRGLLSSTASGSIPTHAEYHAYEHPLVMCVIFHPHVEDWERSLVHSGFQGSP